MDGWLTIGTKIDDNGFDKDASLLKDKLSIVENEQKKVNQTTDEYKKELIAVETNMSQIAGEMNKLDAKAVALERFGQKYSTSYNNVVNKLDDLNYKYGELEKRQQSLNSNINDQGIKYDKLNTKANSYKNSLEKLNFKKQTAEIANANTKMNLLTNSVTKTSNGFQNTINKISKMALSIFGAATAYRIMSSAASTLSQYNKDISANIEYMKFALATSLQPVIEGIINLAHKLLAYIAYIVKAWFGVSLFANASSKAFQNAQKSTSKMKKDTKDIHKNLVSGIDEITNLDKLDKNDKANDESSGIKVPTFDLGNLDDVPIPEWIKWIAENKDLVLGALIGIAGAIAAFKLAGFIKNLFDVAKGISEIAGKFNFLKALGIAAIIGGILLYFKGLKDFLKDPTWENFKTMLKGISTILFGIAMVIGGSLGVTIAAIGSAVLGLTMIIDGVINYLKDPTWENFKTILGGIALVVLAVALIFGAIPALIVAIIAVVAAVGLAIYKHWDEIKTALGEVGSWIYENIIKPVADFFVGLWNGIINGVKAAINIVKGVFGSIVSFFSGIISKILGFFRNIGTSVGNVIGGAFKNVVNGILSAIENILNFPIKSINKLIKVINKVPGINLGTLSTFKLPRLEKGGIVNRPGPGVNMGSYIAGERGAEAIVPLQNSKFISDFAGEVAGQMNNSTVVDLLLELNRNILELANKPTILDINGKEMARALHSDFKNEDSRQNSSMSVRRS